MSLPSTGMQASIKALETVYRRLREDGGIGGFPELLAGFGAAQRLLGSERIFALEEQLLGPLKRGQGAR